MMIRKNLEATKAATYCIVLPDPNQDGPPSPMGTGFFVSSDGFFVTAAHVLTSNLKEENQLAPHAESMALQKEMPLRNGAMLRFSKPRLIYLEPATDFALLKFDLEDNVSRMKLPEDIKEFSWIQVSSRPVAEGEPVYSFGYPASQLIPFLPQELAPVVQSFGSVIRPRVTSAIVASTMTHQGPIFGADAPLTYVIDKPLNYGNSGGPIIATETGRVFALCSGFQAMGVPQEHLKPGPDGRPIYIQVPSLYGLVSSLSNLSILQVLAEQGVPVCTD